MEQEDLPQTLYYHWRVSRDPRLLAAYILVANSEELIRMAVNLKRQALHLLKEAHHAADR